MTHQSMTESTRRELLNLTESELQLKSGSLDRTRKHLKLIKDVKRTFGISTSELKDISRLLEFKMLIEFISLDLSTATRFYLQAEYQYEGVFSLRSFIVVINEGYKKIYNFKRLNEKGAEILRDRNKSFWIKEINRIVESRENPKLKLNYTELTIMLDNYHKNNFDGIKEQRDLFIHYDMDLVKVYDTLSKLNSEVVFKKYIPFYELLERLIRFSHELLVSYQIKELKSTPPNNMS